MNINSYIIPEDATIIEAMGKIEKNGERIVFVCNGKILSGVATDGDIRRYILKNGDLHNPVSYIANNNPIYVYAGGNEDCQEVMRKYSITALPVIDREGNILKIEFIDKKYTKKNETLNLPVIIMAGGKGTRLLPYTSILPKPLIPIGDKTITEHIMEHFESYGCTHFDMIVNYKKNFIKSYFMDHDVKREIDFIEEKEFLGTGGGLKLLDGKYQSTFFMTNCDILVEEDYSKILKYHNDNNNIITMVCAMKNTVLPYGTIELGNDGLVKKIREKPSFSFMTNTGFYIIEPEFLNYIDKNTFILMTDVIQKCIDSKERVGMYPIGEESWMDMGQFEELEKMKEKLE